MSITNDGSLPTAGAMLDIKSSSKGILIPRVALTGSNDSLTLPNRSESLLIYNTSTTSHQVLSIMPQRHLSALGV